MSNKVNRNKNPFAASMGNPPDDADKLALELQRESANNAGKVKTPPKVAQTVVLDPISVQYAELLIARIGSKSAVRATETDAVISVSTNFAYELYERDFVVSDKASADFQRIGTDKNRRLLRCKIALDVLAQRLPEREANERTSGIDFEYSVTPIDMFLIGIADDAEVVSRPLSVSFNKKTRTGMIDFGDFNIPIITRTRREVYPSRFTSEGKYIPARKSKSDSDDNPTREIYIAVLSYSDGSCDVLRDQGITNFIPKLLRRLDREIVPNASGQTPEELYLWTPKQAEADDDADDSAE